MPAIPQGTTHLEVTDNGATFWSVTADGERNGVAEVWLGGRWAASEINDALMARLVSFAPLERSEPWGENDIIPLGEGSITGEAYRRGMESGRRAGTSLLAGFVERIQKLSEGDNAPDLWDAMQILDDILHVATTLPVKVVVDITGGGLQGVWAELPVDVLFISTDLDDIDESFEEGDLLKDVDGLKAANWTVSSAGGEDAKVVAYFFEQSALRG